MQHQPGMYASGTCLPEASAVRANTSASVWCPKRIKQIISGITFGLPAACHPSRNTAADSGEVMTTQSNCRAWSWVGRWCLQQLWNQTAGGHNMIEALGTPGPDGQRCA